MRKNITVITIIIIIIFIFKIPASAQTPTCPPKGLTGEGLISTPSKGSDVCTTSGASVIDSRAAFLKIPTYADLKSQYYTQSKLPHNTNLPASFTGDGIYNLPGPQGIAANQFQGNGTEVIFIDGDLNITAKIVYHTNDGGGGLVFVVSGNVNIDKSVTQIDAVLISEGIICTASEGNPPSCPPGYTTDPLIEQLVINGSLISIKQPPPTEVNYPPAIKFRRTLTNNAQAAEKINHQVKYLVILRNIFSDTLQRWSEIQ